jgi:NDP-sugar pyrophosphorylase family protein
VSAIVLAGTYYWTGSPFEEIRPRPLLPVALRPLIEYVLDWLGDAGIPAATVCANGSTGQIKRHLDSQTSLRVAIDYHSDKSPRGAAGCIKDAAAASNADTLIVSDGTSIPHVDIGELLAHHRRSQAAITIVVHLRKEAGGQTHLEPTGTYVFDREVLALIPSASFHDIKENLIPNAYRQGRRIELFSVKEASPRVLDAASYIAANRWMTVRLAGRLNTTSGLRSEVDAHPSAWIDDNAIVVGPVLIGRGARVHSSAVVVGPTVIGAGTVIGPGATLARSVTLESCVVGEDAIVDQCLLAEHAAVDAGQTLSGVLRGRSPERQRWANERFSFRRVPPTKSARPFAKPALS